MDNFYRNLGNLAELPSVPLREQRIVRYLLDEAPDGVYVPASRNVLLDGANQRLMLLAHMDKIMHEIGFVKGGADGYTVYPFAHYAETALRMLKRNFIYLQSADQTVQLEISELPPTVRNGWRQVTINGWKRYSDVLDGLRLRSVEPGIYPADGLVTVLPRFQGYADRMSGKLDDALGMAAALEYQGRHTCAFTMSEEVKQRGAEKLRNAIRRGAIARPDAMLVLDVCPGTRGNGIMLINHRYPQSRRLDDAIVGMAAELGIGITRRGFKDGDGDAGALRELGLPIASLCVPVSGLHNEVETAALSDVEDLRTMLKTIDANLDELLRSI